MTALLLDCDGVLADTERDGHLVAFNLAFAELGLRRRWTMPEYARLLGIGGGKERLATLFTEPNPDPALPADPAERDEFVARLHAVKTQAFVELVEAGKLTGRPGVRRVIEAALDDGWALAVASTSAERSVRSVLESVVGADTAARFSGIFAGDRVRTKKPAPDIYLAACAELGAGPGTAVVIEDSAVGAAAATAAGLGHLVTVSGFTRHETFPAAAAVMTSLGTAHEPARCLAHVRVPAPGPLVGLDDLRRCAAAAPGVPR